MHSGDPKFDKAAISAAAQAGVDLADAYAEMGRALASLAFSAWVPKTRQMSEQPAVAPPAAAIVKDVERSPSRLSPVFIFAIVLGWVLLRVARRNR